MGVGTCQLCRSDGVSLVKAHIIPKSLYGDALDHQEGPAKLISDIRGNFPRRSRIGVYDDGIVCAICEALFSPWDDYAHELLFQTQATKEHQHDGKVVAYEFDGIDYVKLKLFFISLLWRAHVSTQQFFRAVNVGPFAATLVKMIQEGDPGDTQDFAVFVARFDHPLSEAFADPYLIRPFGAINGYAFYFARHMAYIKVDKRPLPDALGRAVLTPGQPFYLILREFLNSKQFNVIQKIAAVNKRS